MIIMLDYKCVDCGHDQETEAINPEFDNDGAIVDCYTGSSAYYCDSCGSTQLILLQVREVAQ